MLQMKFLPCVSSGTLAESKAEHLRWRLEHYQAAMSPEWLKLTAIISTG
jgi:hypothetical protein